MATDDEYNWRETRPGVWQRSTDEAETFYYALAQLYRGSGRKFFHVTGHLVLHSQVRPGEDRRQGGRRLDAALKKAWLALRLNHPTIASIVQQDPATAKTVKAYHALLHDADADSWLADTLVPVQTGQTGQEWANADPPAPDLPTLFVVEPPPAPHTTRVRRDLVLRSPHDIIDGIGTLLLFGNLVAHIAEALAGQEGSADRPPPLLDGSEISHLSPPFRVAARVPPVLTQPLQQRLARMTAQKTAAAQDEDGVAVLGIPFQEGQLLPGTHQRVALRLSTAQTARILAACKSIGVTVTQAFHAAAAITVRDVQPPSSTPTVRYVNYILRNERSSCIDPFNSARHAAAVYHSVSGKALTVDLPSDGPHSPHRPSEYLRVVEQIKRFYEDVRQDQDHYALAPSIWAALTPTLPPLADCTAPPPVPPPKVLPSVSMSSMGRIDALIPSHCHGLEVHDPWVTGEELTNGLGLFLGTYRDELCLSAAFNDAWHDREEVLLFLKHCTNVVLLNLGVDP